MKTIRHDARVGEVQTDQRAISGGQIHAHHAHLRFSFQPPEIRFQGKLRTAQHYIVDPVIPQVAQGCGITFAASEEVLVDAQHTGTAATVPLAELALESVAEVALDGSRADGFPPFPGGCG